MRMVVVVRAFGLPLVSIFARAKLKETTPSFGTPRSPSPRRRRCQPRLPRGPGGLPGSTRLPDPPSTATRTFVPHPPSATLASCARKARRGAIADPCRPRRYRPRGAGGRDARETLPDGSSRLRRRAVPRRETLVVRYEERVRHRTFYEYTWGRLHKIHNLPESLLLLWRHVHRHDDDRDRPYRSR